MLHYGLELTTSDKEEVARKIINILVSYFNNAFMKLICFTKKYSEIDKAYYLLEMNGSQANKIKQIVEENQDNTIWEIKKNTDNFVVVTIVPFTFITPPTSFNLIATITFRNKAISTVYGFGEDIYDFQEKVELLFSSKPDLIE